MLQLIKQFCAILVSLEILQSTHTLAHLPIFSLYSSSKSEIGQCYISWASKPVDWQEQAPLRNSNGIWKQLGLTKKKIYGKVRGLIWQEGCIFCASHCSGCCNICNKLSPFPPPPFLELSFSVVDTEKTDASFTLQMATIEQHPAFLLQSGSEPWAIFVYFAVLRVCPINLQKE